MSNITEDLKKILESRYGKDVRQAIHDAINDCYEDGKAGTIDTVAREDIATINETLGDETLETESQVVTGAVNEIKNSLASKIYLERYDFDCSSLGFDGTTKETLVTFTDAHSGYSRSVVGITPYNYSSTHFISFYGNCTSKGNTFYIEHNLTSSCTKLEISVLYVS